MNNRRLHSQLRRSPVPYVMGTLAAAAMAIASAGIDAAAPVPSSFTWETVVNNEDGMPGSERPGHPARKFNSYNPPSVNAHGLVVIRARSRGGEGQGGEGSEGGGGNEGGGMNGPTHGIYTRDMASGWPVVKILDRTTEVPAPNNTHYPPSNPSLATFIETPSFPRIDIGSDTIATRGNHQPVWEYALPDGSETRAGTTGIYTDPFGALITGASKLGAVPDFGFYEVPGEAPGTPFDVFPGSPAVTDGDVIVFKGNYTTDGGKTGVFYRELDYGDTGGFSPVQLIANNTDTLIPGTGTVFGSTAPPSAARGQAVFAGFDNEQQPTLGGIYLAPLQAEPPLTTLASIGGRVPGESVRTTFTQLGEGCAFDGRYVAFWGAWGMETKHVRLYCPTEGNANRIAYCLTQCPNGCAVPVPLNQGVFVYDAQTGKTSTVAKTGKDYDDFLFWNFSGMAPDMGLGGHGGGGDGGGEDDGEPARWRSSAFLAVSERGKNNFYTAFKAMTDDVVGLYLVKGPGQATIRVLDTTTDGQIVDPRAPVGSTVTELGLEREGMRGNWLVVSAKMGIENGSEEDGMAGIYLTRTP